MALEVLIAFNETFNFVDQIINYVCSVIVDFLGVSVVCLFSNFLTFYIFPGEGL